MTKDQNQGRAPELAAQAALGEDQERYRRLFEHMAEGFCINEILWDATGRPSDLICLEVNPAFERQTGLQRAELVGHRALEVFPGTEPVWFERFGRVVRTGAATTFAAWFGPLKRCFEVKAFPCGPGRCGALFLDISDRKKAEDQLREQALRLAYHVDHSPLAVIEWGPDMRLTRWAGEAERLFGWKAEEVLGKRMEDFRWVYQEDQLQVTEVSEDLRTGSGPQRFSANRNYHKDGSIVHCEWYNSSMVDEAGGFHSILSLVLDVSERKRMEAELKEEARRKDAFLALLGHELRNPLAPIRNAVHLLKQGGQQPARLATACAIIERQVKHLTQLVDGLLDVSRIALGKIKLNREDVDLLALVRGVHEDYQPVIASHGLGLELKLPARQLWITADPGRIIQAVSNLLHNAIKFTDPGGWISLVLQEEPGGWARMSVQDTGAGLPPEVLASIFEPFMQHQETIGRSRDGLGLGLTLVKGLVTLHGGEVSAQSGGPGLGSTFTIRLPLLPAGERPAPEPALGRAPTAMPRRVLVVEDLVDAATTLGLVLETLGHTVALAHDGPAGLAQALAFRPDTILCDIGLPGGLDGYGLARAIRAMPELQGACLIAMTGFGTPEDQAKALEAGFDQHLTKPVDPAMLERVLGSCPRKP